ncbi:LuxR C-terminal-related transcriptional regulator [Spirosoma arcticum]
MPIAVAVADDHHSVVKVLADLLQKFDRYDVLFMAGNDGDLLNRLQRGPLPDIALIDLNRARTADFETVAQFGYFRPATGQPALSMTDLNEHIIRMIHDGARGVLLKGCRSPELRRALHDVAEQGSCYADFLIEGLSHSLPAPKPVAPATVFNLNAREHTFLKLACSELTYNDIADRMCVSPRTVDGYREVVFQKMNVRTRVGMVMKAMRHGLVDL